MEKGKARRAKRAKETLKQENTTDQINAKCVCKEEMLVRRTYSAQRSRVSHPVQRKYNKN